MSMLTSHTTSRAMLPVFAILPLLATAAGAQVITGFETSGGYTLGSSIINVDDTGIPGTAIWRTHTGYTGPAPTASGVNPQSGSSAIRFVRDNSIHTGASGAYVDLANAGLVFSGPTAQPISLSFSVAVGSGYSPTSGFQFAVYFGASAIDPGAGSNWTNIIFNNGSFLLQKGNGATNTSINLGSYTTYAPLGQYVNFTLVFDPVAKTYQSLSISGTSGAANLTSSVAGSVLPWRSDIGADPAKFFSLVVGSNDTVTVDFDNLSVSNISSIPEPAHASAIFGVAIAAFALGRRRRSSR